MSKPIGYLSIEQPINYSDNKTLHYKRYQKLKCYFI